jgi:hypothetical protein
MCSQTTRARSRLGQKEAADDLQTAAEQFSAIATMLAK